MTSRTSEILEDQAKDDSNVIKMLGEYVRIVPKYGGKEIVGLFVGEKRLREFSREDVFVIEIDIGIHAFIKREDVLYVVVSSCGFVNASECTVAQKMLGEQSTLC